MANVIKLRKGLDVNLKGKAAKEEFQVKKPAVYALVPDDFTGMKPKVVVKENDVVKVGDSLFVDKNHPEIKFVSPVSGRVTMVERGDRRKVLSVRVEADAEQQYVDFGKKNVGQMTAQEVKDLLLESGLFGFFRQRPYDVTANPTLRKLSLFPLSTPCRLQPISNMCCGDVRLISRPDSMPWPKWRKLTWA